MFNIISKLIDMVCPAFTVSDAKELTSQINIPTTSHSLLGLTFDIWIYMCCCERCVSLRESFSGVRSPQILRSEFLSVNIFGAFLCLLLFVYSPYGTAHITQCIYMHLI